MKYVCTVCTVASLTLLAVASWPALAGDITDKTPCSTLRAVMDSENIDRIRPFTFYILNTLDTLDLKHTEAGEPGIMTQMSDNGRLGLAAMVSVHCQSTPKMTVYNAVGYVYRGIRDMQLQLGVAK